MKRILPIVVTALILSFLSTSTPLFSQVSLVKDINENPSQFSAINDYTELFCNCGDYLFFPATTEKGKELWRTDGTEEGTIFIKDIYKGFGSGFGGRMFCNGNGAVYFLGSDALNGPELWVSNGTESGTKLVKDVTPGVPGFLDILGFLGNTIYFLTDHDADNQMEVWKSDGSDIGTKLVTALNFPGISSSYSTMISDTHIFFNLYNTSANKLEIWKTDGTSGGSGILLDNNSFIIDAKRFDGKVLFAINDQSDYTVSLWSSDGTITGTNQIKDFGNTSLQTLHKFHDKLIFVNSGSTWISDGTESGTTIIATGYVDASTIIENNFYGFGFDYTTNSGRLLKIDGATLAPTILNADLGDIMMFGQIPVLANKLILQYNDGNTGKELGISDDTRETFKLIKDINPGAESAAPRSWATFKNKVYFLATNESQGSQIWCTDGTENGTFLLKHVMPGTANAFVTSMSSLAITNEKLHLAAIEGNLQTPNLNLFVSDGTEAGTVTKFNFDMGPVYLVGKTDKDLIYFSNRKMYKTNGLSSDVILFKDLSSELNGFGLTERVQYTLGNKLLFAFSANGGSNPAGLEYWVTDGTETGTHVLKDIFPGSKNGVTGNGIVINSKFIFDGIDPIHGSELWISDGTPDGTSLLKDISPGVSHSKPSFFSALNNKVIFSATSGDFGNEVWITDGTEQGTHLLADIIAGPTGSNPKNFTTVGNLILFTAYDEGNGWTLWKTDGTTLGTEMIKDMIPGNDAGRYPTNFTSIGNRLFFAADDGEHGMELWLSDGTTSGTYLIDVVEGIQSSNPSLFTSVNGVVYFKADTELWRTNGTTFGTSKISDLEPLEMVSSNNWLYFTAPHPDFGVELFKAEFTKVDQQITISPITKKTFGDAPFQISVSTSSGLPIVVTSSDEVEIAAYTATIVNPGTVELTANQAGDELFNPAQTSTTFCILPSKPLITVTGLGIGEPLLTSSTSVGNQWFKQGVPITNATGETFQPSEDNIYKLSVTIDGCTSEFSEEANIIIMGVETTENFISIFPNPASETLRIKTYGNVKNLSIAIMDIHGKEMGAYQLGENEVVDHPLGNYPAGFYLIRIETEKGISYKKIIKE